MLALGWFLRRGMRRRSPASARAWTAAGFVVLAVATASAARDAGASVSTAVLFEDLVRDADAVATVTPLERFATWEDGRIVTYTRVRVDRAVAGSVPPDPWIRTMGGVVGRIGQIVEGEASFAAGQPTLVFLRQRPDSLEVVARGQGQFALAAADERRPRLLAASNMGMLLPPPRERVARARGGGAAARLARDVLQGQLLEDAVNVIIAAWAARAR
jgi:hypothetical protein